MARPTERVIVTGGAGFIGSHLVERLVERSAQVTVVDDFSTGRRENLAAVWDRIDLCTGDLGALLQAKAIHWEEYAVVYHLAANAYIPPSIERPAFDFQANLRNTFLLLEALRNTPSSPRLVNASSAAVYGDPVRLPIVETDVTVPISPYGVSKLAGERYAAVYSLVYGLKTTSLRFFSVYGPRQSKQVIYDLIGRLRADPTQLEVLGDGSQRRDFAFVGDVVEALLLASERAPAQGEVYNVASGSTQSISELVMALCQVCGVGPTIKYTGYTRPGDAEQWAVNIDKIKQLGFLPKTDLNAGLAAVRDWYDAHN